MTGINTTHSPSVTGKRGFSLISDEKFRQLYAALLQCEMLEQRLLATPHFACNYEPWIGSKASSAAISACLRPGDTIAPTPRGMLANYLHTGSVTCAEINRSTREQLSRANGNALRHKLKKRGNITVVFTPAPKPALMREIFTSASKQLLPVLCVLEAGTPSAELSHGIPVIRVDASDAVAAYRVVFESIKRAREDGGPTIIECAPWPGDPLASNPLLKLENYLAARKLFQLHWKHTLEMRFSGVLNRNVGALTRLPVDS